MIRTEQEKKQILAVFASHHIRMGHGFEWEYKSTRVLNLGRGVLRVNGGSINAALDYPGAFIYQDQGKGKDTLVKAVLNSEEMMRKFRELEEDSDVRLIGDYVKTGNTILSRLNKLIPAYENELDSPCI